jgi:GxxExxY protein
VKSEGRREGLAPPSALAPEERDPLTERVIGAAIAVHRTVGPGMLESVYTACLCHEMRLRDLGFRREVHLPITYAGKTLAAHLRIDLLVEDELVVELKSVERLTDLHRAQVISYLRLGGFHRGLLINFNVPRLVQGVVRIVG